MEQLYIFVVVSQDIQSSDVLAARPVILLTQADHTFNDQGNLRPCAQDHHRGRNQVPRSIVPPRSLISATNVRGSPEVLNTLPFRIPNLHEDTLKVLLGALFAADDSADDPIWPHYHNWEPLARRWIELACVAVAIHDC